MDGDSRIKDFTGTTTPTNRTVLEDLFFAVDKEGYSNAEKINLDALFYDSAVTDNTTDFKFLSPKGFYSSVMDESTMGIAREATDAEIEAKSGAGVIKANDQAVMQAQWVKDLNVGNGVPVNISYSDYPLVAGSGLNLDFHYRDERWGDGSAETINPTLPTGVYIHTTYTQITFVKEGARYNATIALNRDTGGASTQVQLGTSGIYLIISAGGAAFKIGNYSGADIIGMYISLHSQIVTDSVI